MRPTEKDPKVIENVRVRITQILEDYLDSNSILDPPSVESEVAELIDMYQYSNGYKLAKMLDDQFNWEPNSDLVDQLDSIKFIVHEEIDREVQKWVKENNILPKYKIGDEVVYNDYHTGFATLKANIVKIYEKEAKYGIQNKQLADMKRTRIITY